MDEDDLNPRAVENTGNNLVGHVIVVGFHAQLGSRIEFSYPMLRGTAVLRTPRLSDTQDVADHGTELDDEEEANPASRGEWGYLPEAWSFLPHMALPDGAHDSADDTAYFCLPPNVHCVACFRQTNANEAVTVHAGGSETDTQVAARGSVQKSVVLLCKRPIYGVLGDRLSGVVRAYFDQGDFARTDVLARLFHSINNSLSLPSWNDLSVLVHGLDLRALVRTLKGDLLRVLKLILLEKRVVFISQPVRLACNAVASVASVFPAAFDRMSPSMEPLDYSEEFAACGFPLEMLSESDIVAFQPYAPLPVIIQLLSDENRGCLLGTARNCGVLLKTAMESGARANLPSVDAIIDVHTGQISVKSDLEPYCALTREESVFVEDLVQAASHGKDASGTLEYISSDDHLRTRLRDYLRRFLGSVATVEGVLHNSSSENRAGAEEGGMTVALAETADWSAAAPYNISFVKRWLLMTSNSRSWARACDPRTAQARGVPAPLMTKGRSALEGDLGWFGEKIMSSFMGTVPSIISPDAVEKMSEASARAVEGVSGLFHRLENELKSIESALREKAEESKRSLNSAGSTGFRTLEQLVDNDSGDITNMPTPTASESTSR